MCTENNHSRRGKVAKMIRTISDNASNLFPIMLLYDLDGVQAKPNRVE